MHRVERSRHVGVAVERLGKVQLIVSIRIGFCAVGVGVLGQGQHVALPLLECGRFGKGDHLILRRGQHVGDPGIVGVAQALRMVVVQPPVGDGVVDPVEVVPQRPTDLQPGPDLPAGTPGFPGHPRHGLHAMLTVGHSPHVELREHVGLRGLGQADQSFQVDGTGEQFIVAAGVHVDANEVLSQVEKRAGFEHGTIIRRGWEIDEVRAPYSSDFPSIVHWSIRWRFTPRSTATMDRPKTPSNTPTRPRMPASKTSVVHLP